VQFLGEPIQWVQTARYLGSSRWERGQLKD
jgi:hypothetical protein